MKLLRPIVIVLAWTISVLMIAQTAAAAGKGGKGPGAALAIDIIRLIDDPPQGGEIIAEISGGGFLGGSKPAEVTLDGGAPLDDVFVVSAEMIIATIPALLATDGDHEVMVTTGGDNKENDSAMISLGGEMSVSCISWFVSGPADEHVHTEVHVEDENGDAVIGATVKWTAGNDTVGDYQENVSLTHDNDGHAAGENCDNPVSGSGVTDWFCCIGAGKWDGETPPGRRACAAGEYTARIVSVTAPLFTNMIWDEVKVETSFTLENTKFP